MSKRGVGRVLRPGFDALHRRIGTRSRFLIAGAINTAFGLGIYPALMWLVPYLGAHYLLTLGVAQAISLVFAFTIYKTGVFRTRSNLVREFGTFSTFYLVNYSVNWVALPLLVSVGHLDPRIAQPGFVVVLIVGSYFWHSRVTFRSRSAPEDSPAEPDRVAGLNTAE